MVKLLFTKNPDSEENIPVVLDTSDVEVTKVTLYRRSVEGNSSALNADVSFDVTEEVPNPGEQYLVDVHLYVLTADHAVPMTDAFRITSIADLQKPWDMASTSGGSGDVHAVFVKTVLHRPNTF